MECVDEDEWRSGDVDECPASEPIVFGEVEVELAPSDRYRLVYLMLALNGVAVLMPWNMFITLGQQYFVDYKMSVPLANGTLVHTRYADSFLTDLALFSRAPNLVLGFISVFVMIRSNLIRVTLLSMGTAAVVCAFTLSLVFVDSTAWTPLFYYLTMASVVLINGAEAIHQSGLYAIAALLPARYNASLVTGINLSGTIVSLLWIVALVVSTDIRVSAFVFFSLSFLVVIVAAVALIALQRAHFYKFYATRAAELAALEQEIESASPSRSTERAPSPSTLNSESCPLVRAHWRTLREVWQFVAYNFFLFFVTLVIFPTVLTEVRPYSAHGRYLFPAVPERLYLPVMVFLLFNVAAVLGTVAAHFVQWPRARYLWIVVAARFFFLPMFAVLNYRSCTRTLPVLFESPWAAALLIVAIAFTHGYWSSVITQFAASSVSPSRAHIASMMVVFGFLAGIVAGLGSTKILEAVVDHGGTGVPPHVTC